MKQSILIVNGKNINQSGGYQTYTLSLANKLKENGLNIKIVSLKHGDISKLIFQAPLLSYKLSQFLKDKDTSFTLYGIGPWALSCALCKIFFPFKKIKIITFSPTTFKHEFRGVMDAAVISDYGLLYWLKTRVANLTIIPFYTLLERFFLWQSYEIIIHHKSSKQILMKQFGLPSRKIKITPQFISSQGARKSPVSKNSNLLVSISRQDGRKGINFLLHSIQLLQKRNVKFKTIIAGNGEMLEANKRLAKKLKLKNISFPGYISDKSKLFDLNPIFVLPSLEEGSGSIALLEAQQAGLRIVSTDVDGLPEDVKGNRTAILVPPSDPKALSNAIEKFISNPNP